MIARLVRTISTLPKEQRVSVIRPVVAAALVALPLAAAAQTPIRIG